MVRSSSVFLFVALSYRKERARTGEGEKIICKMADSKGKCRGGPRLRHPSEPPGAPRFLKKRSTRDERNIETAGIGDRVSGIWKEGRKRIGESTVIDVKRDRD
jgi:hypothetical protein